MSRILVTGGSEFLGHNLIPALARQHEVFAGYLVNPPERISAAPVLIDVTQPDLLSRQFNAIRPDLVVHAAAMSRPDECEENPVKAGQLIVEGTGNIARACGRYSARLVHISTDLVFDGRRGWYTEEDAVSGISIYSNCKIDAEKLVLETAPASTILRVSLMYGRGARAHPGQIDLMLRGWRAGHSGTFFTDQYRTPLFAPQVADIVEALLRRADYRGILHAGGGERLSRFKFAELLAERVKARRELIRPGSMLDNKSAAPRGADCSLVSLRLERELGVKPVTCTEGLDSLVTDGYLQPLA
ncbi:MAG TPA: SDR family oxidoreductase [Acidobacteriota bacterium]|nr:SDR family oxidoreductase [Acidobacteriota bacterium]